VRLRLLEMIGGDTGLLQSGPDLRGAEGARPQASHLLNLAVAAVAIGRRVSRYLSIRCLLFVRLLCFSVCVLYARHDVSAGRW